MLGKGKCIQWILDRNATAEAHSLDTLHYLDGAEVCRLASVYPKHLLRIPQQSLHVTRQHNSHVAFGENLQTFQIEDSAGELIQATRCNNSTVDPGQVVCVFIFLLSKSITGPRDILTRVEGNR